MLSKTLLLVPSRVPQLTCIWSKWVGEADYLCPTLRALLYKLLNTVLCACSISSFAMSTTVLSTILLPTIHSA